MVQPFQQTPLLTARQSFRPEPSTTSHGTPCSYQPLLTLANPCTPQVTELFTGYVAAMLSEAARAPAANWRAKDCAIYLVMALTVRGKTGASGATTTNELVNLQDFFKQVRWLWCLDGAGVWLVEVSRRAQALKCSWADGQVGRWVDNMQTTCCFRMLFGCT